MTAEFCKKYYPCSRARGRDQEQSLLEPSHRPNVLVKEKHIYVQYLKHKKIHCK